MGRLGDLLFIWKFRLLSGFRKDRGGSVPEMTFESADGRRVPMSSLVAGKRGGILWMTNLCEDCRRRLSLLQKIQEDHGDRVGIVAVSLLGNGRPASDRVRAEQDFDFELLEDPADEIANVLGFAHPPGACPLYNLLLFDTRGGIRFKTHLSAVKDEKLLEELRKLLK